MTKGLCTSRLPRKTSSDPLQDASAGLAGHHTTLCNFCLSLPARPQAYAERRALRAEVRALAKEERKRQQLAVGEVLSHAKVVCATLTGVLARDIAPLKFDLVVVDEAAQVDPSCAMACC